MKKNSPEIPPHNVSEPDGHWMRLAIAESLKGMRAGDGGPFGCVIVKKDMLISKGHNRVIRTNDPTAHAEVVALRRASKKLGRFDLSDCVLYTSCEPCPMCLSAIYWARIPKVFFANTKVDAQRIGFADQFIYEELDRPLAERKMKMLPLLRDEAQIAFQEWSRKADKIEY